MINAIAGIQRAGECLRTKAQLTERNWKGFMEEGAWEMDPEATILRM